MNSRWVMGNRRNIRIGQSAGKASGRAANLRRLQGFGTTSLEDGPTKQPWKSVRRAKVAKAKMLVRDDSYPSKLVLESVAELLAKHMEAPR